MGALFSSLPAVIAVLVLLAFMAYVAIRVNPGFLIKRLAGLVFVVLGVSFITFILGFWGSGPNGIEAVIGQCGNRCTPTILRNLENIYGLRDPWYVQYGHYLQRLIHGDLGLSFANRNRTVWDILQQGVPVSLTLQAFAIPLTVIVGVPIGIYSAIRAGSRFDTSTNGVALLFYAIPSYLLIVYYRFVTVFLAQRNLPHLPVSGWGDPLDIIAPAVVLAAVGAAFYTRLARTSMLEVLGQEYIRTARAKGLRERVVIFKHALRNAIIPLVTALGPTLAYAVTGAFFVELLFNIPGVANAAVASITNKDLPVIQGTVIMTAVAVALMNLAVDVIYGVLDPRIKVV